MYTQTNFKTKKALKGAVAAYTAWAELPQEQRVSVPEPRPVRYFQPGPFGGNEPNSGTFCCEGPHYPAPHTWYATCTASNGVIVKVK